MLLSVIMKVSVVLSVNYAIPLVVHVDGVSYTQFHLGGELLCFFSFVLWALAVYKGPIPFAES